MVPRRYEIVWWVVAGLAVVLLVTQTALAGSRFLVGRYAINALVLAASLVVIKRWGVRAATDEETGTPAPDPISLVLAGLAALSVWAATWWLMDAINFRLYRAFGPLPFPQPITWFSDGVAGIGLQGATYELQVLFAVVLLPGLQAWLLHGPAQRRAVHMLGRGGVWLSGAAAGVFLALTAIRNVAPAMPWGIPALGGYAVVGIVAAWATAYTRSAWAAVSVYGTYAYATFSLRDDLFRQFLGRDYLDLNWLAVVVVGVFGAFVLLQVIRFRDTAAQPPAKPSRAPALGPSILLPLVLLMSAGIVMAAVEIANRQDEAAVREQVAGDSTRETTGGAESQSADPTAQTPPAPRSE